MKKYFLKLSEKTKNNSLEFNSIFEEAKSNNYLNISINHLDKFIYLEKLNLEYIDKTVNISKFNNNKYTDIFGKEDNPSYLFDKTLKDEIHINMFLFHQLASFNSKNYSLRSAFKDVCGTLKSITEKNSKYKLFAESIVKPNENYSRIQKNISQLKNQSLIFAQFNKLYSRLEENKKERKEQDTKKQQNENYNKFFLAPFCILIALYIPILTSKVNNNNKDISFENYNLFFDLYSDFMENLYEQKDDKDIKTYAVLGKYLLSQTFKITYINTFEANRIENYYASFFNNYMINKSLITYSLPLLRDLFTYKYFKQVNPTLKQQYREIGMIYYLIKINKKVINKDIDFVDYLNNYYTEKQTKNKNGFFSTRCINNFKNNIDECEEIQLKLDKLNKELEKLIYYYISIYLYIRHADKELYNNLMLEINENLQTIQILNKPFNSECYTDVCCKKKLSRHDLCIKNLVQCDYCDEEKSCQYEKAIFNDAEYLAYNVYHDEALDIF